MTMEVWLVDKSKKQMFESRLSSLEFVNYKITLEQKIVVISTTNMLV